jgi:hypothetical protein
MTRHTCPLSACLDKPPDDAARPSATPCKSAASAERLGAATSAPIDAAPSSLVSDGLVHIAIAVPSRSPEEGLLGVEGGGQDVDEAELWGAEAGRPVIASWKRLLISEMSTGVSSGVPAALVAAGCEPGVSTSGISPGEAVGWSLSARGLLITTTVHSVAMLGEVHAVDVCPSSLSRTCVRRLWRMCQHCQHVFQRVIAFHSWTALKGTVLRYHRCHLARRN